MSQLVGNPLINVNFIDETAYTTPASDADIVSVIVDTNWGPCNQPIVCDSSSYRELFNPSGLGRLNGTMATVQRAFGAGAAYVEVLRLGSKESWKFFRLNLHELVEERSGGDAVPRIATPQLKLVEVQYGSYPILNSFADANIEVSAESAYFRLRYPGGFPMRVSVRPSVRGSFMGKSLFDIVVEAFSGFITNNGAEEPTFTVLESLQVSFTPLEANGQSLFYADVIAQRSSYLVADVEASYAAFSAGFSADLGISDEAGVGIAESEALLLYDFAYESSDWELAYSLLESRDTSRPTLLVNSFLPVAVGDVSALQGILVKMSSLAEGRKDCNALLGFPTFVEDYLYWAGGFDLASEQRTMVNASRWFSAVGQNGSCMFSDGIVGWETYTLSTVCGRKSFNLDCTAAWAGRICSVAQSQHNRNQLPSYKAFGSFSGSLVRSLSFKSVVDLHDNFGIGSVYHTAVGNFIFDIRSLYGATESYFARMNVMRVCAALLGASYDIVEQVIHTDAAANRDNRLKLESKLNSLIGDMQARGELRAQSYADVGDTLNTDTLTKGGRYLNIRLNCWFIGLVERVNITVVATDSSVDANISMG